MILIQGLRDARNKNFLHLFSPKAMNGFGWNLHDVETCSGECCPCFI